MSGLGDKRIFLIGGPGGVGKTTLAASLAVRLAKEGHRTVVITVDPAKRLASALGFHAFEKEVQTVEIPGAKGSLHASMLDTKHYFDKLISRFAKSEEQKRKILDHPIYRTMVDSLGGTHEYAAMERLLEFAESKEYDKVVVDTPPSQNAIDLLTAPQRLADFMDNTVLKWFQGRAPGYLKLFRTGTKLAMKLLKTIFGAEFLDSFASFLDNLEGMQQGFRNRHLEVLRLLKDPSTAFLLVTIPTEARYEETLAFVETIREHRIALTALALNQMEPERPKSLDADAHANGNRPLIDEILAYYHSIHRLHEGWAERFEKSLPGVPIHRVPRQDDDIHEVQSLSHLGGFLLNSSHEPTSVADQAKARPESPGSA